MEKYFITGVSGYLGKKIADRLLERGKSVTGIDVHPGVGLDPRIDFHVCDVRDTARLGALIKGSSVVYHTAALVPLTRQYSEFISVNVEGSRSTANAARNAGVKQFVHISSSAVYGATSKLAINSNTPLAPIEPYGLSKLRGEQAAESELRESNTALTIIRPRTILGTERGGIFDLFFSWISKNEPVYTIGPGTNIFQFVHVDDLMDAIDLVTEKRAPGSYNVGTDVYSSLNEAFSNLIAHANSKSRIVHLPTKLTILALTVLEKLGASPLAPWHYKTFHLPFHFDIDNLKSLGWAPRYSNDMLMAAAYDSYMSERKSHSIEDGLSPHRGTLKPGGLGLIHKFFRK